MPRAKTSRRPGPHEAAAGGLVNAPPSPSQPAGDGHHRLPSQYWWYIEESVPRAKTSRRPGPHATTRLVAITFPSCVSGTRWDECDAEKWNASFARRREAG